MTTDPSTNEDSEEYEYSDDSVEIIANGMESLRPFGTEKALTRGTDNVLQYASRNGFSKLLCLIFFHAGCKLFDALSLLCLLVPI